MTEPFIEAELYASQHRCGAITRTTGVQCARWYGHDLLAPGDYLHDHEGTTPDGAIDYRWNEGEGRS